MTPLKKQWIWGAPAPAELHRELAHLNPVIVDLLFQRGVKNAADAHQFMHPAQVPQHSPLLMKDMDQTIELILSAIKTNKHITIFGDYDADGVCAAAIMHQALSALTKEVDYYIPHRSEGYGLSKASIDKMARERDTHLLITVDSGISNLHEIEHARALGMEVIVTDHHMPPADLPPADAIVNPHQSDCPYPFKHLCGAGVAFKVVTALFDKIGRPLPFDPLAYVAIATVADVVPLLGENRTLVVQGLRALNQTQASGLRALIAVSSLKPGKINAEHIGFALAPRLNAAGRMAHAELALQLLVADDDRLAEKIARELNQMNIDRQSLTTVLYQEALEKSRQQDERITVVAGDNWPQGVIGIVASKLCDTLSRPVLVVSIDGDKAKGSARSVPAVHITQLLTTHRDKLLKFGGHALAAGFELDTNQLPHLSMALNQQLVAELTADDLIPSLPISARVEAAHLTWDTLNAITALAPFGCDNPEPIFVLEDVQLASPRLIGSQKNHLKTRLYHGTGQLDAIGFNLGHFIDHLNPGEQVAIAFRLQENSYQGTRSLQLVLEDIQL